MGADVLGTILAYVIAFIGLITIAGGIRSLFEVFRALRLLFVLDEE
jgi:hypothetical protein